MNTMPGILHIRVFAVFLLLCFGLSMADEAGAAGFSRRDRKRRQAETETVPKEKPPLSIESFTASFTVGGRAGSLLSLELSETVYSRLRREDYKDICVFDNSGTPVPFSLLAPEARNSTASASFGELPVFPWQPEREKPERAKQQIVHAPGKADVEIDTQGGIIRIRAQGGQAAPAPGGEEPESPAKPPHTLLVDMAAFSDAARLPQGFSPGELRSASLLLTPADKSSFIATVRMLSSDSLEKWSPAGSAQSLARIAHGENTIERLSLELPLPCPRYLLLAFSGDVPAIRSIAAFGEYSRREVRVRESMLSGRLSPDKRSVSYDVTGAYPLTGAAFVLPGPDVMSVRLEESVADGKAWRLLTQGTIYALEKDGVSLNSPPFPLSRQKGGLWRLTAAGDIPFAAAPELRLVWKPYTLLFLARGEGPWTVAYGRDFPVDSPSLPLESLGEPGPAEILSDVTLMPQKEDPAPKAPDAEEEDGKGILLWCALGLAVLFLSGIALYLLRSMSRSHSE